MTANAQRAPRATEKAVRDIVAAQSHVAPLELLSVHDLFNDLGFDSLDRVEMVFELERAFDIEIDDESAERLKTLADVEQCVAERLSKGNRQ